MRPISVLAARLDSARLPQKPLRTVGGRTLLSLAIESARDAGIFDRIVVVTEDTQILEVARAEGVEPILRVARADDPPATAASLSLEVVSALGAAEDDAVVNLQPTAPFRRGADISAAWSTFSRGGEEDFLLSVSHIDPHFFHWALVEEEEGWRPFFGDRYLRSGAQMTQVVRPDGAIKIARIGALRRTGHFFGPRLAIHPMPPHRGHFVGTPEDLEVAEALSRSGLA